MSESIIKVGVGVVVIQDGKTLLTKRKGGHAPGCFGSAGGHVEFGETPVEAAKREVVEEWGVEIGNIQFVSCLNLLRDGKHYIDISFTAEIVSGEPKIMEPDRVERMDWYDLDHLPTPLFEPVAVVLEAVKTGKHYFETRS